MRHISMQNSVPASDDLHRQPATMRAPGSRKAAGRALVLLASLGFLLVLLIQVLHTTATITAGFSDWRPILIAYLVWAAAVGVGQVLTRGERGQRALFLLPAVFFTVAVVIFPTIFGIYIASLDWNLSSIEGPRFSGFDNLKGMLNDTYYWNALGNMVFYTVAVLGEYAIAFGLALLLGAEIRAQKFFRVVFLLPMMLSPVAVSWMIGKSLLEYRFGPAATLARYLGWDNPAFFASPWMARLSIQAMDAWVSIPFVLIIRIIFKLKLADIVINVTAGGPGGATDTVSSFIYRVYRDRSNVGYGTALAMVYLLMIIVLLTVLLRLSKRWTQKVA